MKNRIKSIIYIVTILSVALTFRSLLHAQQYKPTTLPFQASIFMGGGISDEVGEKGVIIHHCSDVSIKALTLGSHDIPLKSTSVTSACMIETKDYGNLMLTINHGTFQCSILTTPKQEKDFKKLLARSPITQTPKKTTP